MICSIRRRAFLTTFGGALAAWPLAARAQQTELPVIGYLGPGSAESDAFRVTAFRQGLKEAGYVESQNVTINYRWAEDHFDRLPAMAADLVHHQVTVIVATSTPAALAAKAATTTIPIVFETAANPVKLGLVASLNRPGGNVTGVTQTNVETTPKRLELLHELLPTARVIGLLVNPTDPALAETEVSESLAAAHTLGLELHVLNASAEGDFDGVFAKLTQVRADGLVIGADVFFTSHIEQLAALTVQNAVPTAYEWRQFAAAGGLLSYGADLTDAYQVAGGYTGRILKGERSGELPVQQSEKVELFLNLKTAKALGITVPIPVLGRADEVIE